MPQDREQWVPDGYQLLKTTAPPETTVLNMSSIAATSLSPKEPRPEVFSAARISGPGELEIVEMPMPQSPAGEVRIRVEGSGICASNLEVWKGQPWFEYPLEPGA